MSDAISPGVSPEFCNPLDSIAIDVGPHPEKCIVPSQYEFDSYEPRYC